jgi:transposase
VDAPIYDGPRAQTTLERWHQVHGLLEKGVGLLECARRLQLALNTVQRYARAERPECMLRVPKYLASLVDPYREHLRKRRSEDPGVPVQHLFEEIKALGFTGCLNLLHKYINQGSADADRSHISPRRLAPIAVDSGKLSGNLRRPRRYNRRLQRVFYTSALCSIRHCEESRRFYDRKRAEGKRHTQAVLALARRRVNVLGPFCETDGATSQLRRQGLPHRKGRDTLRAARWSDRPRQTRQNSLPSGSAITT